MAEYYVMTNWGPMRATHKNLGKVIDVTKDAPADMDTFLEVSTKFNEIESRLNNMGIVSEGNWLIKEVTSLPTASKDTSNTIYVIKGEGSYATINTGTKESPIYSWVSLGTPSDESDYGTY